jgi:hypothetical protein
MTNFQEALDKVNGVDFYMSQCFHGSRFNCWIARYGGKGIAERNPWK